LSLRDRDIHHPRAIGLSAASRGGAHTSSKGETSTQNSNTPSSAHQRPSTTRERADAKRNSFGEQLRELRRATAEHGGTLSVDESLIDASDASAFPRMEMRSLSGKAVIIQDEAQKATLTLVLLAFRSFADSHLASWRVPFAAEYGSQPQVRMFDVSVNETISSQALSGFVQLLQRRHVADRYHDSYLALNEKAADALESVLPSKNRLTGYALLLDANARVRFRAAGKASERSVERLLHAASMIASESSGARGPRQVSAKSAVDSRHQQDKAR
jgi:hypothetical protein